MLDVHIVENQCFVLEPLVAYVDSSGIARVTGTSTRLADCRKALIFKQPDILLLDLVLPDGSGIDFCAEVHRLYPQMKVIAMTGDDSCSTVRTMLKNGASGYILKEDATAELFEAFSAVMDNEVYISSIMEQILKKSLIEPVKLTKREMDVLQLMADGLSSMKIKDKLGIGIETVHSHRKKVKLKIGGDTLVEMLNRARIMGLLKILVLIFCLPLSAQNEKLLESLAKDVERKRERYNVLLQRLKTERPSLEEKYVLYDSLASYVEGLTYFGEPNFTESARYHEKMRDNYFHEAIRLAEANDNVLWATKFNARLAMSFQSTNKDSALYYFAKAEHHISKGGVPCRIRLVICLNRAYIHATNEMYAEALADYIKVLHLYEEEGDGSLFFFEYYLTSLCNMGEIHCNLRNYERAGYYAEKAMSELESRPGATGLTTPHFQVHYIKGMVALEKGDLEEAWRQVEKALLLTEESGYFYYHSLIHCLASSISLARGKYEEALSYARKSLGYLDNYLIDEKLLYAKTYNALSSVYLTQENFGKAEEMAFLAWEKDSFRLENAPTTALILAETSVRAGKVGQAERFLQNYDKLLQAQTKEQFHTMLTEMEVKYETDKKEMRITSLERSRLFTNWLSVAGGIIFLMAIFLLLLRHRHKVEAMEREKHLIATRTALDIELDERTWIARNLHDGAGAMLNIAINQQETQQYESASILLREASAEVRRVAHHLMPEILVAEGLRAAVKEFCSTLSIVSFHFAGVDRRLDKYHEIVLYRCVWELVGNSIRHAKASHIEVHLTFSPDTAYLTVLDDGCGFDLETTKEGMGISNIRSRLSVFGGLIDIYSEPGKGTESNIELGHIA